MARWRLNGTNWEGRTWRASAGIIMLADQLSIAFPSGHGADGTVASKAHDKASPNSDHRPKPLIGPGTVRAIDVGINSPAERAIPETLRQKRDPRVKYAILDGRIFDNLTWTWRPYTGINPHTTHFHLSVTNAADTNGSVWDLGLEQQGGDEDMATAQEIWFYPIPDEDDDEGTRGASHALRQAWGFSKDAARDAAIARKIMETVALGGTLTQAQIDAIAKAVAAEIAQRLQA